MNSASSKRRYRRHCHQTVSYCARCHPSFCSNYSQQHGVHRLVSYAYRVRTQSAATSLDFTSLASPKCLIKVSRDRQQMALTHRQRCSRRSYCSIQSRKSHRLKFSSQIYRFHRSTKHPHSEETDSITSYAISFSNYQVRTERSRDLYFHKIRQQYLVSASH